MISNDVDVGLEKDCGMVTKGFIHGNGNVCSKTVGGQEFRLRKAILQWQKWLIQCVRDKIKAQFEGIDNEESLKVMILASGTLEFNGTT